MIEVHWKDGGGDMSDVGAVLTDRGESEEESLEDEWRRVWSASKSPWRASRIVASRLSRPSSSSSKSSSSSLSES